MEDLKKKKLIWIDQDIYNEENEFTYQDFALNLPEFDIIRSKSVKEAFDIIIKNYEDYKFKLFYVIISGTLSEQFFNEYVKKSLELHILCATIIYCSEKNRKYNELKPFYLDNFLNPGKVTDLSYYVIDYIKSVQCPYYLELNELNKNENKEKLSIINEDNKNINDIEFAAEFTYVPDLGTMAFPILISKHINCSLIEKEELEIMQKENIKLYPKLKHLFKPSEEKDFFIPYHILGKYYLYLYTKESNFYVDMNKELKERQFDKHRTYIYLMYNGLNKGIFKSYCKSNLYRGGTLSNEEFKSLMDKYELQKHSNLPTNKIFFFSRKFLSFSKKEEVANYFLQKAIFCNFTGVFVRFIVEGIEDEEFFVSNIDINEMKLSAFSEEEEVLFLPLSCFEVIEIINENFYGYNIKVIRLSYLNKYKKIINDNFEEILKNKNGIQLEEFMENAINSKYSKGICKYLNHDFKENFYNEIRQKTNAELNYNPRICFQYKNSNPTGKKFIVSKKFINKVKNMKNSDILLKNAEKLVDNFNIKICSYQLGKFDGRNCIACYDSEGKILYFDDGQSCQIPSVNDQLEMSYIDIDQQKFVAESEKYNIENITLGKLAKLIGKNKNEVYNEEGIKIKELKKLIDLKNNKINYKKSGAIEATMVGNILGHLIANFDINQFKKANKENKIKMIADSATPIVSLFGKKLIGAIPIFKNTSLGTFFRNGFIAISLFELCRNMYDIFVSDVLTTGEKIEISIKKIVGIALDCTFNGLSQAIGMNLALCFGFVAGPGAIIVGGLTGVLFGYIGGKIIKNLNKKEIKRELVFYSDSLYFKYIPKKYREYAIPTLRWKDPPLDSKSFTIELIVNEDGGNPSWLVINIPAKPKEMEINELSKEGETMIKYRGIPENAFSGCFCLYVFNIPKINYKDFKNMKNGLVEGEELRKHLIDYKMLIVS